MTLICHACSHSSSVASKKQPARIDAGVVDENIDPTEPLYCFLHEAFHLCAYPQISRHSEDFAALHSNRRSYFVELSRTARSNGDLRTLGRVAHSNSAANAAAPRP